MSEHGERRGNPITRIILASMAGTTIEFFDFYNHAPAAMLIFPRLFVHESAPATAIL